MKRMLCLICSNSACPTHNIITTLMCTIKKSSCVSFWQLEYSATVKCSAFNSCLCHKCLYYIKQSKESLLILFTSLKNIKKLYCSICSLSEFLNSLISVLGPKTPYELGPNVYILFCVWAMFFWSKNMPPPLLKQMVLKTQQLSSSFWPSFHANTGFSSHEYEEMCYWESKHKGPKCGCVSFCMSPLLLFVG